MWYCITTLRYITNPPSIFSPMQIAHHHIQTIHSVAKILGWKTLSLNTQVGVGSMEPMGNAFSIALTSPQGDRWGCLGSMVRKCIHCLTRPMSVSSPMSLLCYPLLPSVPVILNNLIMPKRGLNVWAMPLKSFLHGPSTTDLLSPLGLNQLYLLRCRVLSIRSGPMSGMKVSVQKCQPPAEGYVSASSVVRDPKWSLLGGPFQEVHLDHMEGRNSCHKIELLMACLGGINWTGSVARGGF